MSDIKFKETLEAEKKRINEKRAFKKFKKQLLKLDSSINSFNNKYL
jgi:hypothetical protein